VSQEPFDVAEGSAHSSVAVQMLRNAGTDGELLVSGDVEDWERPIVLGPGEALPQLTLGSLDPLYVRAASHEVPVDVIVTWA
jgi:hypothetical protein